MKNEPPQQNGIGYFRGQWPDAEVPPDCPVWLHYEIDTVADVLLRTVEVFADGGIERDSIALEERKGDKCPSLTDVSIIEAVCAVPLAPISADEFEEIWERGTDTPFWFTDRVPKTGPYER